jgi:hypothetical protein
LPQSDTYHDNIANNENYNRCRKRGDHRRVVRGQTAHVRRRPVHYLVADADVGVVREPEMATYAMKRLRGSHVGWLAIAIGALETAVPMLQGAVPNWVYVALVLLAAVLPGVAE